MSSVTLWTVFCEVVGDLAGGAMGRWRARVAQGPMADATAERAELTGRLCQLLVEERGRTAEAEADLERVTCQLAEAEARVDAERWGAASIETERVEACEKLTLTRDTLRDCCAVVASLCGVATVADDAVPRVLLEHSAKHRRIAHELYDAHFAIPEAHAPRTVDGQVVALADRIRRIGGAAYDAARAEVEKQLRAEAAAAGTPDGAAGSLVEGGPRMIALDELIAELGSIRKRFGNTCVYIRDASWGAAAMNRRDADEKQRQRLLAAETVLLVGRELRSQLVGEAMLGKLLRDALTPAARDLLDRFDTRWQLYQSTGPLVAPPIDAVMAQQSAALGVGTPTA